MTATGITARLASIRARIAAACARAGRDPSTVSLIAVTKSLTVEQAAQYLPELAATGVRVFGENRLDHLAIMESHLPVGCSFAGIGRLQSRQLPDWVRSCTTLHSIADPGHVSRLARAISDTGRTSFPVFLQVNTSGEAQKAGVAPEALPTLLDAARREPNVSVVGLMTMAPDLALVDADVVRRTFAECARLAQRHGLSRLSMGMSGDFELAIEAGATDIRLGSVLFSDAAS